MLFVQPRCIHKLYVHVLYVWTFALKPPTPGRRLFSFVRILRGSSEPAPCKEGYGINLCRKFIVDSQSSLHLVDSLSVVVSWWPRHFVSSCLRLAAERMSLLQAICYTHYIMLSAQTLCSRWQSCLRRVGGAVAAVTHRRSVCIAFKHPVTTHRALYVQL